MILYNIARLSMEYMIFTMGRIISEKNTVNTMVQRIPYIFFPTLHPSLFYQDILTGSW